MSTTEHFYIIRNLKKNKFHISHKGMKLTFLSSQCNYDGFALSMLERQVFEIMCVRIFVSVGLDGVLMFMEDLLCVRQPVRLFSHNV